MSKMNRFWGIFNKKQHSIRSAAAVLVTMVFVSRVLGLVRDRMLSARFNPDELGVYFAAFRVPNFIFELLVMGALTSAFIPVFTKYVTQKREDDGFQMASTLINVSIIVLFVVAIPILVFTTPISRMLAPGFGEDQIAQMVLFTRIMVISQVLPLLIGNFFTGILQSYNLFLLPAIAPVLYNTGIIAGIIFLTPHVGLLGPVYGVGIGAIFFLCIQIPAIWTVGYRYKTLLTLQHKGVREVIRLIGPRTFGLAASQIDTTIDLMLASLLGARMVTIFNFAQHLQQFPVGLFGATIAQAALPSLSVFSVKDDVEGFKKSMISAMHQILFFVLPASVLFIVLRIPIVRLVFGASRFDWEATVLTGMTLSMFAISLGAQSVVHVLARGFYALYDTKTPVLVSVLSIVINSVGSIICIKVLRLPIWSLGLTTSISSIVNAGVLFLLLTIRMKGFDLKYLVYPMVKMLLAALAAGVAVYVPLKIFDQLVFDTTRTLGLILLTGTAGGAGIISYLILVWLFDVNEMKSFLDLISRVRRPKGVILAPANEVINGGIQDKLS